MATPRTADGELNPARIAVPRQRHQRNDRGEDEDEAHGERHPQGDVLIDEAAHLFLLEEWWMTPPKLR